MELEIIGNIGKDAVVIESNGNKSIAFNVGETVRYKNKEGERIEKTTWVKCYGKYEYLKNVMPYLLKGTQVQVKGVPSFHMWKNENTKNMQVDIRCTIEKVKLLSPKKNDSDENNKQNVEKSKTEPFVDNETGEIMTLIGDEFANNDEFSS
jgi:single-strand DNA-binding protein